MAAVFGRSKGMSADEIKVEARRVIAAPLATLLKYREKR
jgi:hypothetical protein